MAPMCTFSWSNTCQILPIKLVSEKPGERTVNQIPQRDGPREEVIDQSAFMEAIKQNLSEKKPDRIAGHNELSVPSTETTNIKIPIQADYHQWNETCRKNNAL